MSGNDAFGFRDDFLDGETRRVNMNGIWRRHQWRYSAGAIAKIKGAEIGLQTFGTVRIVNSVGLYYAALFTREGIGIEEYLYVGIRENDGPDVAAFHDDATLKTEFALALDHPLADLGMSGDARCSVGDIASAYTRRDIAAIE